MPRCTVWLLALAVALVLIRPAGACPLCKEAVVGDPEQQLIDDPYREARAYHTSVYIFAGMPFLLLGTCGLLIHRQSRRHQALQEPSLQEPGPQEDRT